MKAKKLGRQINKLRNNQHIDHLKMASDLMMLPERLTQIEQGKTMILEEELDSIKLYLNISDEDLGFESRFENVNRPKHILDVFRTPKTHPKFRLSGFFHALTVSFKKGFNLKWNDASEDLQALLFHTDQDVYPTPHLYIKGFILFAVLFGLGFLIDEYTTVNFALNMLAPFTWLILMQELHRPKTVSVMQTLTYFAVGGILSILLVMLMRDVTGYPEGILGHLLTGFVEEFAKLLVVIFILRRIKAKYILTAVLVGFAVGAGFDVFESADYGIIALLSSENGYYDMIFSGMWRGLFALIGIGHHFWTAILAGGLLMLRKTNKVTYTQIFHPTFICLFLYVMVIHAFWNYSEGAIEILAGIAISMFSFLLILHKGLSEVQPITPTPGKEEGEQPETLYIA